MKSILKAVDLVEARLALSASSSKPTNDKESMGENSKDMDQGVNSRRNSIPPDEDLEASANTSAEGSAFDVSQRLIYLQVQGDSYSKLYHIGKHTDAIRKEFANRALAAYEAAIDLASSSLDSTNPLRLLIVCSFCHAVHTLPIYATHNLRNNEISSVHKIRRLAMQTFNAANSSAAPLSDEAIYLLQVLRDNWMTRPTSGHEHGEEDHKHEVKGKNGASSDDSAQGSGGEESEDDLERAARELHELQQMDLSDSHNRLALKLAKKKKLQAEAKKRLIAATKSALESGKKPQVLGKTNNAGNINSMGVFTALEQDEDEVNLPLRTRAAANTVRYLRSLVTPVTVNGEKPQAILLDRDISHGHAMRAALRRIFNVYVQGTALVGFQGPRGEVALDDGQTLTIGNFLLQGPFIGFRGFAGILRDFGICKVPQNKWSAKGGRNKGKYYGDGLFPSIFDAMDSLHLFHNGDPPLAIKEATMLFIECSRSSRPALTLKKYLPHYQEIGTQTEAFEDSFSGALEWGALPVDSWGQVTCGLTYMQFLDFIGKAAIVAYSSEQFDDILPTKEEKIEHFLHAQMGLLDQRRWLPKVEGRVHSLKVQIENVREEQERLIEKESKNFSGEGAAATLERQLSAQRTPFTSPRPQTLNQPNFVKTYK